MRIEGNSADVNRFRNSVAGQFPITAFTRHFCTNYKERFTRCGAMAILRHRFRGSLRLVRVAQDFNEYFPKGFPSQNHFERIATQNSNWSFGISRAVHGNHTLVVQKHLVAACFVGAMAVPVSHRQYAAAIGHGVDSKGIRSSTSRIIGNGPASRISYRCQRIADSPLKWTDFYPLVFNFPRMW